MVPSRRGLGPIHIAVVLMVSMALTTLTTPSLGADPPGPLPVVNNYFQDRFDDDANLSLMDGCYLKDGHVFLDYTEWSDDFCRTSIDPWVEVDPTGEGSISMDLGQLKCVAGSSNGASVWAERSINLSELRVELKVRISAVGVEGPQVLLLTDPHNGLALTYNHLEREFWIATLVSGAFHVTRTFSFDPTFGNQYSAALEFNRGGYIRGEFGGQDAIGRVDMRGPFTAVRIGVLQGSTAHFDDVTVKVPYRTGAVASKTIALPEGMQWSQLHVSRHVPEGTGVLADLLDGETQEPIPGFYGVEESPIPLQDIDPTTHPTLMIRVRMYSFNFDWVSLDVWTLQWHGVYSRWVEPFEAESSVGITGGLEVRDGALRSSNVLVQDGFQRTGLGDWSAGAGDPKILDGALWLDGLGSGYSRADLEMDVPGAFSIAMRAMMETGAGGGGPRVNLTFASSEQVVIFYQHTLRQVRLVHVDGTSERTLYMNQSYMNAGIWYDILIEYNGTVVEVDFAYRTFMANLSISSPLEGISLSNFQWECVRWDDVSLTRPFAEGVAVTPPITAPNGLSWRFLWIKASVPEGSCLHYSVLDGDTSLALFDLNGSTDTFVNISRLRVRDHPNLVLRFNLSGGSDAVAEVHWCEVGLQEALDRVFQDKAIPTVYMQEDTPVRRVLNITHYFRARYTPSDELSYTIVNGSDPDHVWPYLEGFEVSVDLPVANWFGNVRFQVNCSSPEHTITSDFILVIVEPVNDPPVVEQPLEFYATEDSHSVFNLSPYLEDVDDPVEDLDVMCRDGDCTVVGQELHFDFTRGGFDLVLDVEVSDGSVRVPARVLVHVLEVNDPPVILPIPRKRVIEEVEETIDLSTYIQDEDDEPSELSLVCDHSNVVGVAGLAITLLYDTETEVHTITFRVNDGRDSTLGSFEVEVTGVNDPPRIIGLGELVPPPHLRIDEGTSLVLDVLVWDEEGDALLYHAESSLPGVEAREDGTLIIFPPKGEVGIHSATLVVDDQNGGLDTLEFTIEVLNVNDPPGTPVVVLPQNHTRVRSGTNVTFQLQVSDPDLPLGDVLSIQWSSNISGLLRSMTSREDLAFTTSELQVGHHRITVSVTDGDYVRYAWLELTVYEEPAPPAPPGPDGSDTSWTGPLAVLIVAIVIGVVAGAISKVRRRGRPPS